MLPLQLSRDQSWASTDSPWMVKMVVNLKVYCTVLCGNGVFVSDPGRSQPGNVPQDVTKLGFEQKTKFERWANGVDTANKCRKARVFNSIFSIFLLQGIVPNQGLNLNLLLVPHWQAGSAPRVPPVAWVSTSWPFLSSLSFVTAQLECPAEHGEEGSRGQSGSSVTEPMVCLWAGG